MPALALYQQVRRDLRVRVAASAWAGGPGQELEEHLDHGVLLRKRPRVAATPRDAPLFVVLVALLVTAFHASLLFVLQMCSAASG